MTMKTVKTVVAAAFCFAAAMAQCDEAFDSLVKLARTPAEQITAANAMQVLDAGIAVTNTSTLVCVADSKKLAFADIFAKTKNNANFFYTTVLIAKKHGTEAEQEAAFQNYVDTWLQLDASAQRKQFFNFGDSCVVDKNAHKFISVPAIEAAVAKILASDSALKANAIASMIYTGFGEAYNNRLYALREQNFELVKTAILSGEFIPCFNVFGFVYYVSGSRRDYALCAQLLDNIKWFERFGENKTAKCIYLSNVYRKYEPTLTGLRKQYLASVAKNDFQLTTVARAQDETDGNKDTTQSIYSKIKSKSVKLDIAYYLEDKDKIIDILLSIDDSISSKQIEKAIEVINTFDPDYRTADVLKALRVINKKYTLKLYDDHDTWEPILSKVRALIDIYSN